MDSRDMMRLSYEFEGIVKDILIFNGFEIIDKNRGVNQTHDIYIIAYKEERL